MSDQNAVHRDRSLASLSPGNDSGPPSILQSCEQLTAGHVPNFLRLYLNPWVAQVCLCLEHLAAPLLKHPERISDRCPSFLCNSRHEAVSGAIKLARYMQNRHPEVRRRRTQRMRRIVDSGRRLCLIVDDHTQSADPAVTPRDDGRKVSFLPDVVHCSSAEVPELLQSGPATECVVFADPSARGLPVDLSKRPDILSIRCVDAQTVESLEIDDRIRPADVIVFDESFVNFDVPFSAFTTCQSLYSPWMKRSMAMFHSTTFQPSTLPALHFMKCLQHRSPRIVAALGEQLDAVMTDREARHACYQTLYSRSLSRLIQVTGFDQTEPTAFGHEISTGDRTIFDGVAGVACSVRGHNPDSYASDVRRTLDQEGLRLEDILRDELFSLSGLGNWVPAVSGASAVENGLRLALTAQPAQPHVVTLEGGFGGKTLLALTGTAKPYYRKHVGPLYPHVSRIDPRGRSAVADLDRVFATHPVGVVQLELIQGVGGVRPLPEPVLEHLQELRRRYRFLLLVDEVQTGMFRTGPFLRSQDVGLTPDLVTIGKGASDMMFPCAATLYSDHVKRLLESAGSELPAKIRALCDYPVGSAALLNTLRTARREDWTAQVRQQARLFSEMLTDGLKGCPNVRDIRVFGMLTGIELETKRGLNRLLGNRMAKFFSLAMLNHTEQPLLMGFCQYEPGTFKLTPGLLMNEAQVRSVCNTIVDVLWQPRFTVAARSIRTALRNRFVSGGGQRPPVSSASSTANAGSHELLQRTIS